MSVWNIISRRTTEKKLQISDECSIIHRFPELVLMIWKKKPKE